MATLVEISKIKIPKRFRTSIGDIDSLKESINRLGLLQPIGITKDNVLVYGFRRLQAVKALGWKEIPYVLVELNQDLQSLAELEENLKRKDMTWQEEVKAKAELHQLCQALYGQPKVGYRSDLKGPLSTSEKGWGLQRTAEFLNESIGLVSQDIKLFTALNDHPELSKEVTKSGALRRLEKLEHPEKFVTKPSNCDLCGKTFVIQPKMSKLVLCPVCHRKVKPSSPPVPTKDVEKVEEETNKLLTMQEWLGMKTKHQNPRKNIVLHG